MLDKDCIFCKIIRGEIPAKKVYEDDKMLVFRDVAPKAKVHLLAVPKDHFKLIAEADQNGRDEISHIISRLPEIAESNGCADGFRIVVNQGDAAGQTVFHLHFHILGGEPLEW